MNYYIQGDAAKAEQIKAAFEKLGYNTGNLGFISSQLYYTIGGRVELMCTKSLQNIIKTHPDYKELELPVEPKFKVGDWVVFNDNHNSIYLISEIRDFLYMLTHTHGGSMPLSFSQEEFIRPWTIGDAKDGDILTNGKLIVIFNKLEEPAYKQHIIAYIGLDLSGRLQITEDTWRLGVDKAMPATKEQRDLLFAKMKEAGYEWDEKKKELCKIKHYDISNFHAGMPVLVRDYDNSRWSYVQFSHYVGECRMKFNACGIPYIQCIPFNDDTKHLLGTTEMCDECYVNW